MMAANVSKVSSRQFKAPSEVIATVLETGMNKANFKIDQLLILGFLSGVYVSFGGILGYTVSLGFPGISSNNPALSKILFGSAFPVSLMLIVIAGGELFTVFSNYAGAVAGAYFYGYLTQFFASEPYLSGIKAVAVAKTDFDFGVVFLKGIAANQLVNLALLFSIAAQDVVSKMAGCWVAIGTFAVTGYEHSIANMFSLSLSLMYDSPVSYGYTLYRNLIPTVLDIVGGGVLVGLAYYYVFLFRGPREPGTVDAHHISLEPVHPPSTPSGEAQT